MMVQMKKMNRDSFKSKKRLLKKVKKLTYKILIRAS